MSKYYVLNKHTLGYINDQQPDSFWPLARIKPSNAPIGGEVNVRGVARWEHGIEGKGLVKATKGDFIRFRVQPPPGLFQPVKIVHQMQFPEAQGGGYRIEFEINGTNVMISVDDKHIHVIGGVFVARDHGAINSTYILPEGSPFKNIWQYHVYADARTSYGEEKAMEMALRREHPEDSCSGDY